MRSLALPLAVTHLDMCLEPFLPASLQTTFQYCVKYIYNLDDKLTSKDDQGLLKEGECMAWQELI